MWVQFIECFVLGIGILLIPGFMVLKSLSVPAWGALGFAAPISIIWLIAMGVLFGALGVHASLATMFLPLLLISIVFFVAVFVRKKLLITHEGSTNNDKAIQLYSRSRDEVIIIGLTIVISLVLGFAIFVKQLDGPDSFIQEYDNGWNLSLIRSYASTGIYSVFGPTVYPDADFIPPSGDINFYPATWHCLAALLTSTLNVSPALAANALNTVLSFVIFPLGMLALLFGLFKSNRRWLIFAPVLILAFQSFPWRLLEFGPLYSNLSSFAIAPAFIGSFIKLTEDKANLKDRFIFGGLSFVTLIDMTLMQTNAVFTCGVVLIPYCVARLWAISSTRVGKRRLGMLRVGAVAGFLLFVVAVWAFLYHATFMQPIVTFNWPSFLSKRQAVINILCCAISSDYVQPLLAVLIVAGMAFAIYSKRNRWLIVSYVIVAFQYYVCATSDGVLKHVLTGFWYTDSYRIAASMVFVGIPLACMGAYALFRVCAKVFDLFSAKGHDGACVGASIAAGVLLIGLIYYPNFTISLQPVQTAFGMLEEKYTVANSTTVENVLTSGERAFLQEVEEIVPDDAVILNQPYDGSAFAYGLYDMNVYYRYFGQNTGTDSETSRLLRLRVDEWESDPSVAQAIRDADVQYVLLLDEGDDSQESRRFLPTPVNKEGDFAGLENISEKDAPGFVEVLRDGDMVLYEIID